MTTCTTCKPDSYNTRTTDTERRSAAFSARRVEKESKKVWWDHTVTIEVTYCKPMSELPSAKHPNTFLYSGYENVEAAPSAPNAVACCRPL